MRKLMRSIARFNMKKAGLEHLNKKRYRINTKTGQLEVINSLFAENWRKYC